MTLSKLSSLTIELIVLLDNLLEVVLKLMISLFSVLDVVDMDVPCLSLSIFWSYLIEVVTIMILRVKLIVVVILLILLVMNVTI